MERENGDPVFGEGRREMGVGGGKKTGDEWWMERVRTFGGFGGVTLSFKG